ncbi:glycosyltransferase [Mitsuaria sp. WAJ17]|uniref:glycosyltransferase n=1 Tax=Mitsuaria sp. WAJ17 TaxID=2761452 RepID=UPI00160075A3|nr:glycosyltransferase [Mitsuaria sp. WAJ17]MBB2485345.1 glycosyltransferase [Mitsuaria sp. WAJ17]
MSPLVVFSHLRWSFVYQRPQHLMSRLARYHPVLFIEEPVHGAGPARLDSSWQGRHLEVLTPHSPLPPHGFDEEQALLLRPLLRRALQERGLRSPMAWLYTPMALPLARALDPVLWIYDCMDELSAFKEAPAELPERERELLGLAALVFTGGPALYEAKRALHPQVHCMPSAVDVAHFQPAVQDAAATRCAEQVQGALPRPRLGFFGVVDERMDLDLLARLADARPQWQLVMVGPVVKIDPASLPRRPNIHWVGLQSYHVLPALMAGWDVCLMPFALNESTRFISPTKTLEYLAGEKPVVSTPVPDVARLYGAVVRIAGTPEAFIEACEQALHETPAQRRLRLTHAMDVVASYSWDGSAQVVQALLQEALEARLWGRAVRPAPGGAKRPVAQDHAEAASAALARAATLAARPGRS